MTSRTLLKIASVAVLMSVLLVSLGGGSAVRTAYALCKRQDVVDGICARRPTPVRPAPVTLPPISDPLSPAVIQVPAQTSEPTETVAPLTRHHLHDSWNEDWDD